jgi:hypothetical protein
VLYRSGSAPVLPQDRTAVVRTLTIYQILFAVIPIVLAFLHLFLFLYDPRTKENLYGAGAPRQGA